ncbi:DUF262 domain-containing protein [Campylobacter lari]|uniref:DUF262 domain-containing protein n=1 Tax=Campylobacter lari TaxID=201 RepID=UPI0008749D9B|nr:DUF262 domain-containing protein [Campylobacter lari]EHK8477135.1 hypothetical protein [Campylobacter lari]EHL7957895.1 hypothetical protein [Campylobacter lari]EHN6923775.1 hypothetical protein [Campylobacter lari]EHO5242642.1 hypothetical protein [Campylobacter lari]EHP1447550.1 hypothetical protein [Campylobacter lari]
MSVNSCVVSLKELVCGKVDSKNDQKSKIFSKDKFSLNIPDYQRPYAWGIEQVKILLKQSKIKSKTLSFRKLSKGFVC